MGAIKRLADGLVNVAANLGIGRDKAAYSKYVTSQLSAEELLTTYRNSWLARKIVDYPAQDATRKWRAWRADVDQITKIEAVEKSLGLQRQLNAALIAARLYGGAALYINTTDPDPAEPLQPGAEIKSLAVLTRNSLSAEADVRDIDSPYFGKPEYYTISGGRMVRIHASRIVRLVGESVPVDIGMANDLQGWGDSALQSTMDSIKQVDSTMANIASLVFEAKVDVFKFQGFADLMADGGDDIAIRRLQTQALIKGINGAVVLDAEDDYQQKSASFSGLPDIIAKFQDAAAGASGIPVTRLFGRAAAGLSGNGDGDERTYFDRITQLQNNDLAPALALLDECIIVQALGNRPPDIYYQWNPLRQIGEAERAEIFAKTASAARSIAGTTVGALIPVDAMSDALVNELVEQGVLPGLDQAIAKYGTLSEQDGLDGGVENDPNN